MVVGQIRVVVGHKIRIYTAGLYHALKEVLGHPSVSRLNFSSKSSPSCVHSGVVEVHDIVRWPVYQQQPGSGDRPQCSASRHSDCFNRRDQRLESIRHGPTLRREVTLVWRHPPGLYLSWRRASGTRQGTRSLLQACSSALESKWRWLRSQRLSPPLWRQPPSLPHGCCGYWPPPSPERQPSVGMLVVPRQ